MLTLELARRNRDAGVLWMRGDRLLALEAGGGWVVRTVDGAFRDADAEVAYARALLAALE